MTSVPREAIRGGNRERFVIGCGAYNPVWWHQDFRKARERRLRQLAAKGSLDAVMACYNAAQRGASETFPHVA
jgi:hypothetical protein